MGKRRSRKGRGVGRPPSGSGKDTERLILDAAEEVFARLGYSGARTQAIADTAGVTKAMIHYYFDSKEKLYRAVLDRILFELIKLVQEVTASDTTRVEQLDLFVRGFFDYVARHPHFSRLTFLTSGDEKRYFDNIVTGFFRPLWGRGVRFIEAGIEEGVFRRVDASHLLLSIYAITTSYVSDARFISLLCQEDAMSTGQLEAHRASLLDMVHLTLGSRPAS